eukprot:TRINITY_DN4874_c0_g1_i2.p1 TRINITY_DN4874_c0_g1~~TRINITY_DN4874_c0_g1_i2.p1  ORF type:complete len:181 (+),score=30.39 TRINITY_DN4874_c0_g1_i2:253-795(+)
MDEPLFGERSQSSKIFFYGTIGVTTALVLESIGIAILFGVWKHFWEHFFFAGLIVFMVIPIVILYRWYSVDDLDTKFRFLLILLLICLYIAGITLNLYVWTMYIDEERGPCDGSDSFLYGSDGTCYPFCDAGDDLCLYADQSDPTCVPCPAMSPTPGPSPVPGPPGSGGASPTPKPMAHY